MPLTAAADIALQADDLSVELGGLPVLRGVSVTVRPGEAVALLGGNGSGKSTFVRATLGLIPAVRGSVRLFDVPLRSFREWSRIGYVPQRSADGLLAAKVSEVVAAGRLARRRLLRPLRHRDRSIVAASLAAVGLTEHARTELGLLSGGQQQRVMIARALAAEADLLILDEPIAGVDLEHQELLATVLASRLAEGAAMLIVLHETGRLGPLIDRCVVLRDGRVVYDGDPIGLSSHHEPPGRHEHLEMLAQHSWLDGTLEQ